VTSKATMEEYRGFSKETAELTYIQRIQPIYRWRGTGQTVSNSNFQSSKSRVTSREIRSTEDV